MNRKYIPDLRMTSWLINHIRLIEVVILTCVGIYFAVGIWNHYRVPIYEKNAYIEASPETIKRGESVSFTYGYLDKTNNEHLSSAITTVTVETPSKKNFKSNFAKTFPSDFAGANTNEEGGYIVDVERKVKKTDETDEILYRTLTVFYVEE